MFSFGQRTILFLILFFLLPLNYAAAFEHPRYEIKAEVDSAEKKITAQQTVTFTNNGSQDVQELYFHIYPNRKYTKKEINFLQRFTAYFKVNLFPEGFDPGKFDIQSVKQNSTDLEYKIEGKDETLLKVVLPTALKSQASVTIQIDFKAELPHIYGRYGWHNNMIKACRWYPILSVYDKDGWRLNPFYPFHRPFFSESSNYDVTLTVPEKEVVIHSGQLISEESSALKKTLHIKSDLPIRDFTFVMSPDYRFKEEQWNGVTVKAFYLPEGESRAEWALNDAIDAMKFYSERFGNYPYKNFSIAPVYLGYGGEQMSNMIFIDTRIFQLPKVLSRYFDFLIGHETGHQWFYNLVGIDEYSEMWLEEGINSYFTTEYLENKYGADAEVIAWPGGMESWKWMFPSLTFRQTRDTRYKSLARIGMDGPVVGKLSSFQEPSSIFAITYGKGSRILGMLRAQIGEDAFGRAFARIFKEYQHKNLRIEDFIRLTQEESGQDLTAFFDQWLYKSEKLDYAVQGVKGHTITIENRGGIVMPVELRVHFADGRQQDIVEDSQGKGENGKHIIVVNDAAPIERVTIDPEEKFLDIDRTNNSWPRIVNIKPVPFYFNLYDIPVFLPDNGYNVVFGPEIYRGIGVKASLQKPYDQILYAGTDYELGEDMHHSRIGYQLNNVLNTQTAAGVEIANTHDLDNGEDDVTSGKIFLRRELWLAQYGLGDLNDHVSLYLLRNKALTESTGNLFLGEDGRNVDYSRRNESIVGTTFHLNRSGPYPDPHTGYRLSTMAESAGHFLEATQYFYRSAVDLSAYQPVTSKTTLAGRVKYGWGYPDDKELFRLGGSDGLRGFDRKTLRGSNVILGSLEYRFPLIQNLKFTALDNLLGLQSVGGVVFFDLGQNWFTDFENSRLRKDAGFGLRFKVDIGSFLEQVIVRADIAKAINESDDDTQFWFGINHAF